MRASNRDSRAFTLLELLVALLVLSAVAASFWGFWATTIRVRERQSRYLDAQAEVMRVWRALQDDLRDVRMGCPSQPILPAPSGLRVFELPEVPDRVSFGETPKHYEFVVLEPGRSGGSRDLRLGCRAEVRHGVYQKKWKLTPKGWEFNGWPTWFHRSDDDNPPPGLDFGLKMETLRCYESSLERTTARPRSLGRPETSSVVFALATHTGPVFWVWHRFDTAGRPLRRLMRVLPKGERTLVSDGLMTEFEIRPVVEVVAHPGDKERHADFRKLLFEVRLAAEGDERGLATDARPFALATLVYPVVAHQQPWWRWLPARS